MRTSLRWLTGLALLAAPLVRARAQEQTDTRPSQQLLQDQVDELDQRLRVLARLREIASDSSAAAEKAKPVLAAGNSGFAFRSADGNYQLRIRGYAQADGRFYGGSTPGLIDNFTLRRISPILEGTIYRLYDFRLMPDFAGAAVTLSDAYFEARIAPTFAVRAGKFKPPVGLERLQSSTDNRFIELGLPASLVPTRDLGLQVSGLLARGVLSYELGVFNGVADLGNGDPEIANGKDAVARLFLTPFARQGVAAPIDLGFGIGASHGSEAGNPTATPALPSYRSPGQIAVFRYRTSSSAPGTSTVYADGDRDRLAPQFWLNTGPVGLLGEYIASTSQVSRDTAVKRTTARLQHASWQVAGSWFLTGERNSFKSVTPRHAFDPAAHGWGALELAARYQSIRFDDRAFVNGRYADSTVSVRGASAWSAGLNWHLARNVKISLDYEHTRFRGGAVTGSRPSETFIVTRFQTAF